MADSEPVLMGIELDLLKDVMAELDLMEPRSSGFPALKEFREQLHEDLDNL